MNTRYTVEILNKSLEKVCELRALYPINSQGMVIRYSNELSDYGTCTFRVQTKDPVFVQFGDILTPHQYHIRIKRGSGIVWQGAIVDNTERNKNYIEVMGAEYLFYLDKILIRRDKDKPATDEDESNFRVFKTGTMAAAVTTLIQNAAADFGSNHILGGMTVGTIENPNYPNNFVKADGTKLTGAWNFSSDVTLTFDYHTVMYAIKAFGIYSKADFNLDNNLKFNFYKLLGDRIKGTTFQYASAGTNIVDYNAPRFGRRMINHLIGIAADEKGNVLHDDKSGRSSTSIKTYGLLQGSRGFTDVKSKNTLAARLTEESALIAKPEDSPLNIVLDERTYPAGKFSVGDIMWVKIKDGIIDVLTERRIVGITTNVHNTGKELIVVQTNTVPPQFKGSS